MKKAFILILFWGITSWSIAQTKNSIKPFDLNAVNAHSISALQWDQYQGIAFIFVCNHCPMAKLYWPRMESLYQKYRDQGVLVISVNPMDSLVYEEESKSEMIRKVEKWTIPYIQDGSQEIARLFSVEHTPETFLIWRNVHQWTIVYEGAFDDNGEHPEQAQPFLANAIENKLTMQDVNPSKTESFGCRVYYRK